MLDKYKATLIEYAESLIEKQIYDRNALFNGGFFCPTCKNIHGRSIDAIYAFSICYKVNKKTKYLDAINGLLNYSNNLICDDGGIYNDLQTSWRFTTVFQEICLCETFLSCFNVLPKKIINKIKERIELHSNWLFLNLDEKSFANINYSISNCLALYLSGTILNNQKYLARSKHLLNYALKHISKNNLLYGEGKPHNFKSKKGCLAIDIGYNLEESISSLAKYCFYSGDKVAYKKVLKLAISHLAFILPDGAVDNSLGCRNYKWTYYGSRTCEGLLPLFFIVGKDDARFFDAANRNLDLMISCTHKGLLYGGPNYFEHNENPCLHQSFEHINSLAFVVDHFTDFNSNDFKITRLPCEEIFDSYIEEMDSYRISNKNYLLSISNYDVNIAYSGHLTGGTITLLFDKKNNKPIIVGSVGDYQLTEPTNMQVPLNVASHRPGYPRIDEIVNDKYYSTGYYSKCNINKDGDVFKFATRLSTREGVILSNKYDVIYKLSKTGIRIKIKSNKKFNYKVPLVNGSLNIIKGKLIKKEKTFFLTPGFIMNEYNIATINNELEVEIM